MTIAASPAVLGMSAWINGEDWTTWGLVAGVLVTGVMFVVFCSGLLFQWLARRRSREAARRRQWRAFIETHALPCWPIKGWRWLAVRASDAATVQAALDLDKPTRCSWQQGLAASREQKLFISPPAGGWVVILGEALPDPGRDIDQCFVFLIDLSRRLGTVMFFYLNRSDYHHAWAWLERGEVIRAYAWTGQTVWNQGAVTPEETALGLRCLDYGENPVGESSGLLKMLKTNTDKVPELAARWSVDLMGPRGVVLQEQPGIVGEWRQFRSV